MKFTNLRKKIKNTQNSEFLSTEIYYTYYTVIFVIVSLMVFSTFLQFRKSFILAAPNYVEDGLLQHYNSFAYYGHYLRGILKSIFNNRTPVIPYFDLSIGYGMDIINTLSYYVIGDPFSALSVFCPMEYAEYLYGFLILLRIYLAGITFSMYCRYHKQNSLYTLIGCLVYIFSGYSLIISLLHPYFTNPLVYLPLLLLGVDKILKKENGRNLYIVMIAISAISNVYFFYMLCIFIVIYVMFRYFMLHKTIELKELLGTVGKFLLYSFWGICMAMVLFLPTAMTILSSSRLSVDNYIPILYNISYYRIYVASFMNATPGAPYYLFPGYTAIGLIAVMICFIKRKENEVFKYLLTGFLLLTLFLLIPYFGHVMNGMAYVTNRWIWGMAFLVALIIVYILPRAITLSIKERNILLILISVYAIVIFSDDIIRSEKSMVSLIGLAGILLVVILFQNQKNTGKFPICCLICTVIMLYGNAFYIYSPAEDNYINNFPDLGRGISLLKWESPVHILSDIKETSEYRFDTGGISSSALRRNSAMQLNENGAAYGFSLTNSEITQFHSTLYLNTLTESFYENLDRRSYLDAIMGVKYFIIPDGGEGYLPYGYDTIEKKQKGYSVYKSPYALPLTFTSEAAISKDNFEQLDVSQKQQALLQGIVIEDAEGFPQTDLSFTDISPPFTISVSDGISVQNDSFVVSKNKATATLSFDGITNSETYLIFDNIHFEGDADSAYIHTSSMNVNDMVPIRTNKYKFYAGRHNFLLNMGYSQEARDSITITFDQIGTYRYDKLSVVCQPMDKYKEQCMSLKEDTLQDMTFSTNQVSGSISLDKRKLLCFSIPYSKGWTALVDGEKADLLQADSMFMALDLDKGAHDIVLNYETPYLKPGMWISVAAIVTFLLINGIPYIRRKKQ